MLDVATDIAKFFKLPKENIVHVRDRAFNDRSADDLGGVAAAATESQGCRKRVGLHRLYGRSGSLVGRVASPSGLPGQPACPASGNSTILARRWHALSTQLPGCAARPWCLCAGGTTSATTNWAPWGGRSAPTGRTASNALWSGTLSTDSRHSGTMAMLRLHCSPTLSFTLRWALLPCCSSPWAAIAALPCSFGDAMAISPPAEVEVLSCLLCSPGSAACTAHWLASSPCCAPSASECHRLSLQICLQTMLAKPSNT